MTEATSNARLHRELARVIVGQVFLHAAMTGTRMAAPLLVLEQGRGEAGAGLVVALFALTQVFLSLPAGRWVDRSGFGRPILVAALACSFGAAISAIWPIYPVLCVSALFCGGATGVATITLQRHVGRLASTPAQLKLAFSWLAIAPAFSNFVGPLVCGLMIDNVGYRSAYGLMAAFPLIAWLGVRAVRELPPIERPPGPRGAAWDLLRDATLTRLLMMNWLMSAAWDVHAFMVPVIGHDRGLSASAIGSILGAFALAAAFVRLLLPLIASHLREWAMITGALAIVGVVLALYPLANSALLMGTFSAAIGTALGSVQPLIMSMLHQITPAHRHGEALGIRMILVNVSSVATPLLLGGLGGAIGASGVFWAMGAIVTAGSSAGLALRRARGHPPSH